MTTDPDNNAATPGDPRDPESLVRVLLGSASDAERRSVLATVGSDPDAARLAGILADIRRSLADERAEALDAPPASLFENARALGAQLPVPPSWFERATATVLARIDGAFDSLLGGPAPAMAPALRGGGEPNLATFEGNGVRVDASAVRERDGSIVLIVQIDSAGAATDETASLSGDCAVLDADSGAVLASTILGDEGSALIRLEGDAARVRAVDIAVRTGGATCLARGVLLG